MERTADKKRRQQPHTATTPITAPPPSVQPTYNNGNGEKKKKCTVLYTKAWAYRVTRNESHCHLCLPLSNDEAMSIIQWEKWKSDFSKWHFGWYMFHMDLRWTNRVPYEDKSILHAQMNCLWFRCNTNLVRTRRRKKEEKKTPKWEYMMIGTNTTTNVRLYFDRTHWMFNIVMYILSEELSAWGSHIQA